MTKYDRPAQPGISLYTRRKQILDNGQGIPFPFRLARVSFPRLKENALRHDIQGGFVYVTESGKLVNKERENVALKPNGVTFKSGVAINGNMGLELNVSRNQFVQPEGADKMRAQVDEAVKAISEGFDTTYNTADRVKLGLTTSDFISTSNVSNVNPDLQEVGTHEVRKDERKGLGDWDILYNLLTKHGNLPGSQMENLSAKRNEAAQNEISQILSNVTVDNLKTKKEIVEVVRFKSMPQSRYKRSMQDGSRINTIMEDTQARSSTRKLELALRRRSAEILKTIVNSYEIDAGNRVYSINKKGNEPVPPDQELKFWESYNDEIQLSKGLDMWKFAIFEWEPYVRKSGDKYLWPEVFPDPTWITSFLQSRLTDIRYHVPVAFMLDDNKRQQYWAWQPETSDEVQNYIMDFHQAVKNRTLSTLEPSRIDTFDVLDGFTTADANLVNMLVNDIRPISYDIFQEYKLDPGVVAQIQEKVLPISAVQLKDGTQIITVDVQSIRGKMLKYLNELPEVATDRPKWGDCTINETGGTSNNCPEVIWAYTVGSPYDSIDSSPDTLFDGFKDRFHVKTLTANYSMQPIVSPVVNKVFKELKNFINGRPVAQIPDNDDQMRAYQNTFKDAFTPMGNLYLQHVFGQALNNALTEDMIGSSSTNKAMVIAYRVVAQKLLDSIAYAHVLGQTEALHIFHVDVVNRLIALAENLMDQRTVSVLRQVAFAVCVDHRVAGVPLEEKKASFKTMKANVELLRTAAERRLGSGHNVLVRASPGYGGNPPARNNTNMSGATDTIKPIEHEDADKMRLWKHFDYWALVLLDENYFKSHTFGPPDTEMYQSDKQQKRRLELLKNMTQGQDVLFNQELQNLKVSDVMRRSGDPQQTAEQYNEQIGQQPTKIGGVPTRTGEDFMRQQRKEKMGLS